MQMKLLALLIGICCLGTCGCCSDTVGQVISVKKVVIDGAYGVEEIQLVRFKQDDGITRCFIDGHPALTWKENQRYILTYETCTSSKDASLNRVRRVREVSDKIVPIQSAINDLIEEEDRIVLPAKVHTTSFEVDD